MDPIEILKKKFGYSSFRPGQKEIIDSVLRGEDVIAILPTGMGKSLCYQVPGYLLPHSIIIVSPLLSLMQDQVDQLKKRGEKRVVALNSFLAPQEKQQAVQFLERYKFIFLSPEMLMQEQVRSKLHSMDISLVVADEAHCISQWGYDFRPDYLRIGEWLHSGSRPPVLALTATATTQVMHDIRKHLGMDQPAQHIQSLDRPNIRYAAVEVEEGEDKYEKMAEQAKKYAGPGILYTQSRRKADDYARKLSAYGIRAASYHAGMEQEDRMFVQQQFQHNEIDWVCATNAFGMGVHKDDVRQVIHDHVPSSVANYAQEVGRAGRDGQDSLATLYYSRDDEQMSIYVATSDLPEETHVNLFKEAMAGGMSPSQMADQGVLSENHVRVLSYWFPRKPAKEIVELLEHLRQQKIREIYRMKEILLNNSCIRQQIVQTFGQDLEGKPLNCCSKCGLDMEAVVSFSSDQAKQQLLVPWHHRLAALFPDT